VLEGEAGHGRAIVDVADRADEGDYGADLRIAAAPRTPARVASTNRRKTSGRRASDMSASDALVKLIESPLVADLLAVGATAALAAIAGHKFSGGARGTGAAVKAAGKAAATAMGQRISTEVEEIRKVSKARNAGRG
jgi:hypothetical protein